ncbi:MAG: hypothetical protein ACOZNI_07310 [Myxococcota bacterium]
MSTVDAALWSLAVALLALALWLNARDEETWDPGVLWRALRAATRGEPVPALPDVYDPFARLGAGCDWATIASDAPPVRDARARRLRDVRVVWFEPPLVEIPDVRVTTLERVDGDAVADLLEDRRARLVLAAGEAAQPVLQLLHDAPLLRDRLRAVLFVGARPDRDWLAACFTHVAFDTELAREVPYLTLRTPGSEPLPDPPEPPSARRAVRPVDLGEVAPEELADPALGRALAALLAALG